MTLSIPDGLIRALRENRLPAKVEVWHAEREEWVSLAAHPAARLALESIGSYLPASDAIEMVEPEEAAAPADDPVDEVAGAEAPEAEPPDIQLAAAHEFIPPSPAGETPIPEPAALAEAEAPEPEIPLDIPPPEAPPARAPRLDITAAPRVHERRSLEMPPPVERRRSVHQSPPTEPEPAPPPRRRFKLPFALPSRRVLIIGVAAVIAVGYFMRRPKEGAKPAPGQKTVADSSPHPQVATVVAPRDTVPTEVLPPLPVDSSDTALTPHTLELQGVPGGTPEADLETRLRLADALMWDPAADFGSPGNVLRARRKVDAVLNSVSAYRVDMRRLVEGGGKPGDRMEPFDEADRIDAVIHAMGDAIDVLEDVTGRFSVRGGTLEFDRADDARRYNQLRDRADSLLRAPVQMDPHPVIRPPRRLVTQLLTTLPAGMERGASGH